jgi:Na+/H+-dicarboxylate symporter
MRRWGVVITTLYAVVVVGLIVPTAVLIGNVRLREVYQDWWTWGFVAMLVTCQAALLFLSVDTSQRPKPRASIVLSYLITAVLFSILAVCFILCLVNAINPDRGTLADRMALPALWVGVAGAWAIPFYLLWRNPTSPVARVTSWLLKGSVLELLVAVPSHVIVRRRTDCSAPVVTGFGIYTGIAIMLLAFGPSVLLLYRKRMDQYADRKAAGQ